MSSLNVLQEALQTIQTDMLAMLNNSNSTSGIVETLASEISAPIVTAIQNQVVSVDFTSGINAINSMSSALQADLALVPVTGPLTDTQLRASPIPISGSISATNPSVSATGSAIPSSGTLIAGSDGTNLRAVKVSATGVLSVDASATTQPISGSVSVSNFPATQPISGSVSVSNLPASQAVTGTFFQATQPVSIASMPSTPVTGTFFQATQPVSGTVTATGPLTDTQLRASEVPVSGTFFQATQPVSGTVTSDLGVLPNLTKGTQGSTGFSIQDLKDAGRTTLSFYAVAAASGTSTTETAISLTKSAGTGATSSANSWVITSGKTFRITHLSVATRGNATATIQTTTFNLRVNTGGGVTTSSTPIIFSARSATPATASAWDRYVIPIPDGFEIVGNGTIQFGMTAAATFSSNAPTWDVTILGFEY